MNGALRTVLLLLFVGCSICHGQNDTSIYQKLYMECKPTEEYDGHTPINHFETTFYVPHGSLYQIRQTIRVRKAWQDGSVTFRMNECIEQNILSDTTAQYNPKMLEDMLNVLLRYNSQFKPTDERDASSGTYPLSEPLPGVVSVNRFEDYDEDAEHRNQSAQITLNLEHNIDAVTLFNVNETIHINATNKNEYEKRPGYVERAKKTLNSVLQDQNIKKNNPYGRKRRSAEEDKYHFFLARNKLLLKDINVLRAHVFRVLDASRVNAPVSCVPRNNYLSTNLGKCFAFTHEKMARQPRYPAYMRLYADLFAKSAMYEANIVLMYS